MNRARITRDLKEARAEIKELRQERARAIQAEITKAKGLASHDMLGILKTELGEPGFHIFKTAVTNEPKETENSTKTMVYTSPTDAHRKAKQRAGKLARKTTRRARK